jgi:hypothetical protein
MVHGTAKGFDEMYFVKTFYVLNLFSFLYTQTPEMGFLCWVEINFGSRMWVT